MASQEGQVSGELEKLRKSMEAAITDKDRR